MNLSLFVFSTDLVALWFLMAFYEACSKLQSCQLYALHLYWNTYSICTVGHHNKIWEWPFNCIDCFEPGRHDSFHSWLWLHWCIIGPTSTPHKDDGGKILFLFMRLNFIWRWGSPDTQQPDVCCVFCDMYISCSLVKQLKSLSATSCQH